MSCKIASPETGTFFWLGCTCTFDIMASLGAEAIIHIGNIPVTNTIVATVLLDLFFVTLVIIISKNARIIPGRLQSLFEITFEYFYGLTEQIADKYTKSIFPWFMSFFLVIFFSNLLGLLPGFGSIGFFEQIEGKTEFIPTLRAATSDFNTTLALATVSVVATHVLAIKYNGIKGYLGKFFSINPILLFVGFLELISEFTKLFSLSFRLFGNIYAGEVVLTTISSMFAFLAPIPFLMLEVIVALVQALVFAMLTMVFMSILVKPHTGGGDH